MRTVLTVYAGCKTLLAISAGAGDYYLAGTQMDIAQRCLDYVLLMTYDLRGSFQVLSGHHTNLYDSTGDLYLISAASAVHSFLRADIPRLKIVIRRFTHADGRECPTVTGACIRRQRRGILPLKAILFSAVIALFAAACAEIAIHS